MVTEPLSSVTADPRRPTVRLISASQRSETGHTCRRVIPSPLAHQPQNSVARGAFMGGHAGWGEDPVRVVKQEVR